MGLFLDLYRLKIKIFFGAIKSSRISILLVVLYFLSILPGSIVMSITIADYLKNGATLTSYMNYLSLSISSVIAMVVISTLRGYTAFEYEQVLIFTSPISPRIFLAANMLADLTALSIFILPFLILLGNLSITLELSAITILSLIAVFSILIFLLLFLKASFSILVSAASDSLAKLAAAVLTIILLLPAAGMFLDFPLTYETLPYPSTFIAELVIDSLNRMPQKIYSLLGLLLYFLASSLLFLACSKKNLFRIARPIPFVSPFDASMRMQTAKMEKNIRFFSKIGLRFSLSISSESSLHFLMKKEMVRMIRDGSIFTVFLIYSMVSIIIIAPNIGQSPFPVWMLLLSIYAFIIPAILLANWRTAELDNLWIPLTSGLELKNVTRSLLYDSALIAFSIPAGTISILALLTQINPLVSLVLTASISLIGCSSNLFIMMHFLSKKRRATPSIMIVWVSMLLSGLLSSPIYIYAALSLIMGLGVEVNLLLAAPIITYSFLIFLTLSRKTETKAQNIEL